MPGSAATAVGLAWVGVCCGPSSCGACVFGAINETFTGSCSDSEPFSGIMSAPINVVLWFGCTPNSTRAKHFFAVGFDDKNDAESFSLVGGVQACFTTQGLPLAAQLEDIPGG